MPEGRTRRTGPLLLRSEDLWAAWLGLLLLLFGLAVYLPGAPHDLSRLVAEVRSTMLASEATSSPHRDVEWYLARDALVSLSGQSLPAARRFAPWVAMPESWQENPLDAFGMGRERAEKLSLKHRETYKEERQLTREMHGRAVVAQADAQEQQFKDDALNQAARNAIRDWRDQLGSARQVRSLSRQQPYQRLGYLLVLGVALALLFLPVVRSFGASHRRFLVSFAMIFGLAVLAQVLAAHGDPGSGRWSWPFWAVLIGLGAGSLFPSLANDSVVQYRGLFFKTGLMLLAAQAVVPRLLFPHPGLIATLAGMLIVGVLLWRFLPAFLENADNSLKRILSLEVGVGGYTALFAVAAPAPPKPAVLLALVLLACGWTGFATGMMPALLTSLQMGDAPAGLIFGAMMDPGQASLAATAMAGDDPAFAAEQYANAKFILVVLLGIVVALGAGVSHQQRMSGAFPWITAGGMLVMSGILSLIYAVQGPDWSEVMLDRGLFPGWLVPLRDWLFTLALICFGMQTRFSDLLATGLFGRLGAIYIGGQFIKLFLLLAVVTLIGV